MDPNTRLRIATRIRIALLRHLGEGVDVARMLKSDAEAREVLWVCEATGDRELITLARQFVRAGTLADDKSPGGHAQQDTAWAHNTSGFGLSQPLELTEASAKPAHGVSTGWLNPVSWLRRAALGSR